MDSPLLFAPTLRNRPRSQQLAAAASTWTLVQPPAAVAWTCSLLLVGLCHCHQRHPGHRLTHARHSQTPKRLTMPLLAFLVSHLACTPGAPPPPHQSCAIHTTRSAHHAFSNVMPPLGISGAVCTQQSTLAMAHGPYKTKRSVRKSVTMLLDHVPALIWERLHRPSGKPWSSRQPRHTV